MPTKTKTAETVETAKAPEPRYELGALKAHAPELFGVSRAAFGAAVAGCAGPITVEEARAKIAEWKKKPVTAEVR